MKSIKLIQIITAFVLFTTVSFAQKLKLPDNIEQYIRVEKLSKRVLIITNSIANNETVTAIATKKGVVIIDAGMNPPVTEIYKRMIEKEFNRKDFIYLINTHSHSDHTYGNPAFSEAKIIGQVNGKKEISKRYKEDSFKTVFSNILKRDTETLKTLDSNSTTAKELAIGIYRISEMFSNIENNFIPPAPSIMFNDKMTLDMGDVTFKLYYFGKAHTQSDILIYIPEEQVVFTGDLFGEAGNVGFDDINKTAVNNWYSALNSVLLPENEIKYVVRGHNRTTMNREVLTIFYNNVKSLWDKFNEGKELYNAENLKQILDKSGLDSSIAEFHKLRTTEKDKYFFLEGGLNNVAYDLLNQNKVKEAIEIFKMNVELFPESFNVYDSLGEAYMKAGNKELAIENYEKSLKLNPESQSGKDALKRLNEQK